MLRGALRTARYARSWKAGADVATQETEITRGDTPVPATLVVAKGARGPLPGWIAIGGISCMGRHHPQLVRFAGALASSGAAVLVPEIPEWRRLELAPGAVAPTLRGCVEHLRARPEVSGAPLGLIGFSFGAPQVAVAAGLGDLHEDIAGVVLFGGYCSLERTMTCQLTGEHEWSGLDYRLDPDPFGGWVVASNHLTRIPGLGEAQDVQSALGRLALAASGQRIPAWDPRHDVLIRALRRALPREHRRVFDLFATATVDAGPPAEARREMALILSEACRRADPLLDPAEALPRLRLPTRLIHGRGDRLIPFTEALRLRRGLPTGACRRATVTGLFDHTADSVPSRFGERSWETVKLFEAIRGMINVVRA